MEQRSTMVDLLRWILTALQMALLVYCLLQVRLYNQLTELMVTNQLLQLRGVTLMAEQIQRHDEWAEHTARELLHWKAQVDSTLAAHHMAVADE